MSLHRTLRHLELYGQHGLGAPIRKASRADVLRLYEPDAMAGLREEAECAFIAHVLSPVLFWCRFCRVTLEGA